MVVVVVAAVVVVMMVAMVVVVVRSVVRVCLVTAIVAIRALLCHHQSYPNSAIHPYPRRRHNRLCHR